MNFLSDIITGPFAGIIVMAAGILISVFAGFSGSKKLNITIASINSLIYAGSIYIYIRNYIIKGPVAGSITNLGLTELILSVSILFCGLNILFFMSLERQSRKSFIREMILLSFSIISVLTLIIADDPVLLVVSLIISILSIFNLISSIESDNTEIKKYIGRFGMRIAIPAALILFGFSVLAGTGSMRKLSYYINAENTGDALLLISVIIFGSAIYLYCFMYPFQGPFLNLARRMSNVPSFVLWFLYIPAGLVLLIRFDAMFSSYYNRENIYSLIILGVFAFLNLLGSGLGAIRASNIRRILSMFILFQLGTIILIRASAYTGLKPGYATGIYDIAILTTILIAFLPISVLTMIAEKEEGGEKRSGGIENLIRSQPYIGICFIIMFIWWLAADVYIFIIRGPLPGAVLLQQGIGAAVISIGYIAALLLMAANIARIILIFFNKPADCSKLEQTRLPRVFYIYLSFFLILALVSVIMISLGRFGIEQDNISLWGNTFYILGNGN